MRTKSKTETFPTSFRLDGPTQDRLRWLAARWGVSRARVIELLVQEAEREGREIRPLRRG